LQPISETGHFRQIDTLRRSRHDRRHAHLAPRGGSTRRGAALAPGAQASPMPRRLYAERRLLHPAVAQRAAVDRKAWIGATQPADSKKSLPALSIRATRVSAARMSPKARSRAFTRVHSRPKGTRYGELRVLRPDRNPAIPPSDGTATLSAGLFKAGRGACGARNR